MMAPVMSAMTTYPTQTGYDFCVAGCGAAVTGALLLLEPPPGGDPSDGPPTCAAAGDALSRMVSMNTTRERPIVCAMVAARRPVRLVFDGWMLNITDQDTANEGLRQGLFEKVINVGVKNSFSNNTTPTVMIAGRGGRG